MRLPGNRPLGAVKVKELTAEVLVAEEEPVSAGSLCAHAQLPHPVMAATTAAQIQMPLHLSMFELASGLNAFQLLGLSSAAMCRS